jgi:hypothetical protein
MSGRQRDIWLSLGLFLMLVVILTVSTLQEDLGRSVSAPLSPEMDGPKGASVLVRWLTQMEVAVTESPRFRFAPPATTDAVALVLAPTEAVTAVEWWRLDGWVRAGGTLIVAGSGTAAASFFTRFDLELAEFPVAVRAAAPATPLLHAPALPRSISLDSVRPIEGQLAFFEGTAQGMVVLLTGAGRPLLVTMPRGSGRVILSTFATPFSNFGLAQNDNAALVRNLLAAGGWPAEVWLDRWHQGERVTTTTVEATSSGPAAWLRQTPAGRALIFAGLVLFAAALLSGRRLGRAVPPRQTIRRRARQEYITAIANLSRRAGHQAAVQETYRRQLKRALGSRYRLDPRLPDDQYVAALAAFNHGLDTEALAQMLARTRQPNLSESELITLAREVADWLNRMA